MLQILFLIVLVSKDPQPPATPPRADIQQIAESGRCADIAEPPDQRVAPAQPTIAPGPPPILSFRLYEGKRHGRFNNSDLMLDDAGH